MSYLARRLGALGIAILVATHCGSRFANAADLSPYEKMLEARSIKPEPENLVRFLRELHPDEDQRKLTAQLLVKLGSDQFSEREEATSRLLSLPALPIEALVAASKEGDFEVRWRAKNVLERGQAESSTILFAIFKTIEHKKAQGAVNELLRAMPLCQERHLRTAARDALVAVAKPEDAERLRTSLKEKNADIRAAAAAALGAALKDKAAPDLHGLLDDPQEEVALAAARSAADLGDRKIFPTLLRLMNSEDVQVRVSSSSILRELTSQNFDFFAYDAPEKRAAALAKWKEWIDTSGSTAALKFPLDPLGSDMSFLNGNTLLAFGYQNKVIEYDPAGKEVWSTTAGGAWSAEKLASGNVLIAAYNENRVIEVDPAKKIVWELPAPTVLNARPIRNGNYLISTHTPKKVQEVSRDKKVVWEYTCRNLACDAHRLENGNTLIAEGNAVIEVTPDGKIVWEYVAGQPYGCQPLKTGNVLIADLGGKVIEVTRDKKVVWEFAEANPVDVFRLPNGNTLITGGTRFLEVTPDKKIVWSQTGCNYGTARR
jgi:hypothetical protein